jgi:D-3-phosphoglycerate dehydrogenase
MKVVSLRAVDRVTDIFEGVELVEQPKQKYDADELVERVGDADAVYIHAENQFTEDVLSELPSLQVIGKPGSGVDNIDLDAAAERGIPVFHTPGMNAVAVAEYNVGLLIALLRQIPDARDHLAGGGWRSEAWEGTEIRDKTVGIVGLGQTGTATAERLAAFDVDLLTTDPYVDQSRADEVGAEMVGMDQLLAESDIVLLHVRLTPETEGLLGAAELDRMKDSAVLVNTARGRLIDREALLANLEAGTLAGAALDVFHEEPPAEDDPLVAHPNVLATPHLAGATAETRRNVLRTTAENVMRALNGEPVDESYVANPDALE